MITAVCFCRQQVELLASLAFPPAITFAGRIGSLRIKKRNVFDVHLIKAGVIKIKAPSRCHQPG